MVRGTHIIVCAYIISLCLTGEGASSSQLTNLANEIAELKSALKK